MICAIAARNLVGLSTTPAGLYADEASIGYNAWTIAHFGVDEHGATLPLFFQAFGEWKNPVYVYLLVPFVWLFGLTTAVVRTPAALFGIVTAVALAGFARRATGSRAVALATLAIAGATPWLALDSRVGFEVPSMVACLAVMLWCLGRAAETPDRRLWFGLAGVALGLAVFAYTVGRLEGALLAAAIVVCFGWVAAAETAGPLHRARPGRLPPPRPLGDAASRAADGLLQLDQHRRRPPLAGDPGRADSPATWRPTSAPPSSS